MALPKNNSNPPQQLEHPFNLRRHIGWLATLLVMLTGMAIRTYFTTQALADQMPQVLHNQQYLMRNDTKQDQALRDDERDYEHLRQRFEQCDNRGGNGDR